MEESAVTLLIAIGSTLLVIATMTLIGLAVAKRLDGKGKRSDADEPPPR